MNTQYLVLIVGHNASGKTKLSKILASKFDFNRVSGDDVRDFLISHISYYNKTHYSYPSLKIKSANKVVAIFRKALIKELLAQGESVMVDGGGIERKARKVYLGLKNASARKITTIIVEALVPEKTLLRRLIKRDASNTKHYWVKFYNDIRKHKYQAVASNEADYVFRYTQKNTAKILRQLKSIMR